MLCESVALGRAPEQSPVPGGPPAEGGGAPPVTGSQCPGEQEQASDTTEPVNKNTGERWDLNANMFL